MELNEKFTSVFSYAAGVQLWITGLFKMNGHEIKWTFAHDFAIAEWTSGQSGVRDTLKQVREQHQKDYKAYAQAVAQLSAMADMHYQLKQQGIDNRDAWIDFYRDLFDIERVLFNQIYENDADAKDYLFELYD